LQGLQNPVVLQTSSGPVVEEISSVTYRILTP